MGPDPADRQTGRPARRAAGNSARGAGLRRGLILLFALAWSPASPAAEAPDAARTLLRDRLLGAHGTLHAGGTLLTTADALVEVYRTRRYAPLWLDPAAWPRRLQALRDAVRASAAVGLQPADYHRQALSRLPDSMPTEASAAVDAELLLSDSFLLLARHLARGKTDPVSVEAVWTLPPQDDASGALLVAAVTGDRVGSALATLGPTHEDYARLVAALARLRDRRAAGGFTIIAAGPTLRPGEASPRVPALRRRLQEAGLPVGARDLASEVYDPHLVRAVRIAQRREGLVGDGLLGARTLAALNRPVQTRIDSVLASLERFRWLPMATDEPRIIVDVAGFRLRMEAQGERLLDMPVVVGRDQRQTPMFSARMTHVVLNPSWEVPPAIALDKVRALEHDPQALADAGFEVLTGWDEDARRVPLDSIDWQQLPAGQFPFRLRQRPGPMNALGQVKFMFPNAWDVYLHDSPDRHLFAHGRRDYSAGCVRLSRPLDLLYAVFEGSAWTPARLDAAIASGRERTLMLARPLAVYLQYWTAAIDGDGRLRFSEDVYGRDAPLLGALRSAHPTAS
ncbi:MAG TPA: L,D-transpeptidase family protein [Pseudomonadales bacterium]|nr:L,D-transpeptidase family protein [Pseudomonadales bacterium]